MCVALLRGGTMDTLDPTTGTVSEQLERGLKCSLDPLPSYRHCLLDHPALLAFDPGYRIEGSSPLPRVDAQRVGPWGPVSLTEV
jgi:hypothetical protein